MPGPREGVPCLVPGGWVVGGWVVPASWGCLLLGGVPGPRECAWSGGGTWSWGGVPGPGVVSQHALR